jgi:hypothetical protein
MVTYEGYSSTRRFLMPVQVLLSAYCCGHFVLAWVFAIWKQWNAGNEDLQADMEDVKKHV